MHLQLPSLVSILPTAILIALSTLASPAAAAELGIENTHQVDCPRKTTSGDTIQVHYRGTLQSDGSEFDSSYKRNSPLSFTVGTGRVIKGFVFPHSRPHTHVYIHIYTHTLSLCHCDSSSL